MSQHILNCFEIRNAAALRIEYQLLEVDGPFDPDMGDGDMADRNLQQLVKRMQYQEQSPVAVFRSGRRPLLAVPAAMNLSRSEYDLTPDVASLKLLNEKRTCGPMADDGNDRRIGLSFLGWHLRSPFFRNNRFWSASSSMYFNKTPLNFKFDNRDIDVYRGFGFRLDYVDGRLCVWVKLSHRYAETKWLLDAYDVGTIQQVLRMRHVLYHYGQRWFPVQILGVSGKSIKDQTFIPDGEAQSTNVYDYTQQDVGEHGRNSAWIRALDEDSPAIAFRYPGNEKKRSGAAALCKLLVPTDDSRTRGVHRWSILDPQRRVDETCAVVREHLQRATLGAIPITVSDQPLSIRRSVFNVPPQSFGQDKRLVVGRDETRGEISLRDIGRKRWEYLLDTEGGVAATTPLDAQYLVAPASLDRQIVDDVQDRFEKTARSLLKRSFSFSKVIYEDDKKRTLKQQIDAIMQAMTAARIRGGRGLLVLPPRADAGLHNLLKRKLRDQFHFQCIDAARVHDFYELVPNNGRANYRVRDALANRFTSYVRYATMGLLLVNRQCPWVLADGSHYEMYIGVDVLRHTAAFTFFSQGGRRCHTKIVESQQSEKLSRAQVRTVILDFLRQELIESGRTPASIVLRRDGRSFRSEWSGLQDAVAVLVREGKLSSDVLIGMIEVHKSNSDGIRLVEASNDGTLRNPTVGAWKAINEREGVICTTGFPFKFGGTVKPLLISIAEGNLDLKDVLEDTFALSQLCWPVPDRCMRLSIDLKLCDDNLRSNAGSTEDDEGQFGEDDDFDAGIAEVHTADQVG